MSESDATGVKLRVAASRAWASSRGPALLVYVTLEIEPTLRRQSAAPLNLAIVIDRSGSMFNSDRLQLAQEAGRHLIGALQPEDSCTVITFADTAQLLARGRVSEMRAQLLAALDRVASLDPLDIGGGSELAAGLVAGYTSLRAQQEPEQI